MDNYARAMSVNEIPYDDLTAEEAMKRWPQLKLEPHYRVLYQADAGIANPRLVPLSRSPDVKHHTSRTNCIDSSG